MLTLVANELAIVAAGLHCIAVGLLQVLQRVLKLFDPTNLCGGQ